MNLGEESSAVGRFFVYGTLKPDQLGFPLIADCVDSWEAAEVEGWTLWSHDGLAFLRPVGSSTTPARTPGMVLMPKTGAAGELSHRIERFENRDLYKRVVVPVTTAHGTQIKASTYAARGATKRGDWEPLTRPWDICDDTVLADGFPQLYPRLARILGDGIKLPGDHGSYWQHMLPLQGDFLSLCTVLERVALLSFSNLVSDPDAPVSVHSEIGPTARMARLDRDPAARAAVVQARPPKLTLWRIDRHDAPCSVWRADPEPQPDKPFQTWYTARSNLSHQGKEAGLRSFDILFAATAGLFDTLATLVSEAVPAITARWLRHDFDVTGNRLSPLVTTHAAEA